MPEFNLIKFEGKPLEKLIDVVSKGIGTLYQPKAIRNEADSKAYEITVIEQARAKAKAEGKELEAETYLKIQERILFTEAERQKSIDNIVHTAAETLNNKDSISNEPVNKDWSKRFFNIAQDVSDEEMQIIWGRILAEETSQPNSYSLRTLEFLKTLSKNEAEIFIKFAELRITSAGQNFVFNLRNNFLEQEFGISFSDKLLMHELGLLSNKDNLAFSFKSTGNKKIANALHCGEKDIVLTRNANVPEQSMEVLVFTKIGLELSKLVTRPFRKTYIEQICSKFKHPNVLIEFGNLVALSNDKQTLFNKVTYDM